ncbi:MAG: DUF998 domain-containing protein [Actinomycetota bacterium]|nr:DUF998 domain-containing protein [Actinomycetota bacterium]
MSRSRGIIASACGLALFLLVVLIQPLLEPAYDPLRQGISEFVHTDAEGLVLAGFLAWASSLAILAGLVVATGQAPDRRRATLLEAAGLGAAVAGLLLVTCFATDRGAEVAGEVTRATTTGRIHDIGSAMVIGGVLLAVMADAARRRDPRLAVALLAAAVVASAILFALGDPLPGLRQRCLLACGCFWQAVVLLRLWDGALAQRKTLR